MFLLIINYEEKDYHIINKHMYYIIYFHIIGRIKYSFSSNNEYDMWVYYNKIQYNMI